MPKKISDYWKHRVEDCFANREHLSPEAIANELRAASAEAPPDERDGYPAERWIRSHRRLWDHMEESERAPHRYVRWPETFDSGLLPWEAAADILEQMAFYQSRGAQITVRWARWFWRVRSSAPTDAPAQELRNIVGVLAATELLGGDVPARQRAATWWLAFRAWETDAPPGVGRAAYEKAVEKHGLERWAPSIEIVGDTTVDAGKRAMLEFAPELGPIFEKAVLPHLHTRTESDPGGGPPVEPGAEVYP